MGKRRQAQRANPGAGSGSGSHAGASSRANKCWAVIAASGTAGHVYPGIATAQVLRERGLDCHFALSRTGVGAKGVRQAGFGVTLVFGRGIRRSLRPGAIWANLGAAVKLVLGSCQLFFLLGRLRPRVMLAMGGYVGLMAAAAAFVWRIRIVTAEQNYVPGLANSLSARLSAATAVAFADTDLPRAVHTGNPVRREIVAAGHNMVAAPSPARVKITIMGGSLGAGCINAATAQMLELASQPESDPGSESRLEIFHIVGQRQWDEYRHLGEQAKSSAPSYSSVPFADNMDEVLSGSQIVVGRAGAGMIAELAVLGLPAILVPLKGAPRDHQSANARILEEAGAAVCIPESDFTGSRLLDELKGLVGDPLRLRRMSAAALDMAMPEAAQNVADLLVAHAKKPKQGRRLAGSSGSSGPTGLTGPYGPPAAVPNPPGTATDKAVAGKAIHVVGIGGAGMSAVAEVLLGLDCRVSGSDIKENFRTQRLSDLGASIAIGHSPQNLGAAELVVHSSAIASGNIELSTARDRGLEVWDRAAMLRAIGALKQTIAVAGTHGKTTTASMVSLILLHDLQKPSYIIGADVNEVGSGACWNAGRHLVVEADESDGSFLALEPTCAIVTSVDPDHHTRYENFGELRREFARFLGLVQNTAIVHTQALAALRSEFSGEMMGLTDGIQCDITSYGTQPEADYQITDFAQTGAAVSFKVRHRGRIWTEISLPIPGLHNAENALAALLAAHSLGVSPEVSAGSLERFAGISRRFEFRGTQADVTFIDDYAHLPAEVAATIAAAAQIADSRIVCVFQPHRYSRTKHLWQDFGSAFAGVDMLVLTDVYSAGEMPLPGVTGELIAQAVDSQQSERLKSGELTPAGKRPQAQTELRWAPRLDDVVDTLARELKPNDVCLVLGAGDIHLVIDQVKHRLSQRQTPQRQTSQPQTKTQSD